MTLHKTPVPRDMVEPDLPEAVDIAAPVALQLGGNGSPVHELDARLHHSSVRGIARVLFECARGVGHDEDVVALLDQAEGWEGDADFGEDAAGCFSQYIYPLKDLFVEICIYLMITCFFPVALTAFTKSSLSMALIWPGRRIRGASGRASRISLTIGPLGPESNEVVRIEGAPKYFAVWARPRTFVRNSVGSKSRTSWMRPDYTSL